MSYNKATYPFQASTTAQASGGIPAGTAPTSPNEGDFWNDSTQKAEFIVLGGLKQALVGCIFTATADKTSTNTTSDSSIVGSGTGSTTMPTNFLTVGKTIRIRIGGIYSTPITGATATVKIKLGSTVIASVATTALLSNASGLMFDGEVVFTCRTTGGSGTVMTHGYVEYQTGVAGTLAMDALNNAGATTVVDTTASKVIDVTVSWDTAVSTKIVTSKFCAIEVLN